MAAQSDHTTCAGCANECPHGQYRAGCAHDSAGHCADCPAGRYQPEAGAPCTLIPDNAYVLRFTARLCAVTRQQFTAHDGALIFAFERAMASELGIFASDVAVLSPVVLSVTAAAASTAAAAAAGRRRLAQMSGGDALQVDVEVSVPAKTAELARVWSLLAVCARGRPSRRFIVNACRVN